MNPGPSSRRSRETAFWMRRSLFGARTGPRPLDQTVDRDDLVRMKQQHGEDRPLLVATERERAPRARTSSDPSSRNSIVVTPVVVSRGRTYNGDGSA